MGLNATTKGGGGNFKPLEEGVHVGVLDRVVDLGVQASKFGEKRQVYLRWQIPSERVEWEIDGEKREGPAVIGRFFTFSLHEKGNLRPFAEALLGKPIKGDGLDLFTLLGRACQLDVRHKTGQDGSPRANIAAAISLPRGMAVPPAEGDPEVVGYSTEGGSEVDGVAVADDDALATLPPWLQEIIGKRIVKASAASAASSPQDAPAEEDPF